MGNCLKTNSKGYAGEVHNGCAEMPMNVYNIDNNPPRKQPSAPPPTIRIRRTDGNQRPSLMDMQRNVGSNGNNESAPDLYPNITDIEVDMQAETSSRKPMLVAAIDFGTTYSGYAFSYRHEYEADPLKISTNLWPHSSGLSMKAPTAILFGQDGSVKAFGYDAVSQYVDLVDSGHHNQYYYYHRFKMHLYKQTELSMEKNLREIGGKEMLAIDVFAGAIGFLKGHLIQRIHKSDTHTRLEDNDIQWVVTVPAIWGDKAKQFMRRAAEKAGIEREQLILALEPEAASLFCKYMPTFTPAGNQDKESHSFKALEKGTKYMVVDLGGGTVDITVHGVHENGALEELHRATGGHWGGTTVDDEFKLFLMRIFGHEIIQQLNDKFPSELLEIYQEFEIKKRHFEPGQTTAVSLKIPACLIDLFRLKHHMEISDMLSNSPFQEKVKVVRDKLQISPLQFSELFASSVSSIISQLRQLLNVSRVSSIDTLLLVGGYAESQIIQEAIVTSFPQFRIIHPNESMLAVLKGAVIFGHEPQAISSRISKYTYGIAITEQFQPDKHPENKLRSIGGVYVCDDVFDKHLQIGEQMSLGGTKRIKQYEPHPGQRHAVLDVYASSESSPNFVTDDGCTRLGSVVIELSPSMSHFDKINVSILYVGTELSVEVREAKTGKLTKAFFDFLG